MEQGDRYTQQEIIAMAREQIKTELADSFDIVDEVSEDRALGLDETNDNYFGMVHAVFSAKYTQGNTITTGTMMQDAMHQLISEAERIDHAHATGNIAPGSPPQEAGPVTIEKCDGCHVGKPSGDLFKRVPTFVDPRPDYEVFIMPDENQVCLTCIDERQKARDDDSSSTP